MVRGGSVEGCVGLLNDRVVVVEEVDVRVVKMRDILVVVDGIENTGRNYVNSQSLTNSVEAGRGPWQPTASPPIIVSSSLPPPATP